MTSKNLNLLREMTWCDFKLRYNGSFMGFFWSFLKPLIMLTVLYIIFSTILNGNIEHYAAFLLIGIIIWNFLVEATSISMYNIIAKRAMIKTMYFPKQLLVVSSCLSATITLFFNVIILSILIIIFKVKITIYSLSAIIIFLELFMIVLGISFILSALYVKYRDTMHIWDVILQVGFWASPIVYTISMIPLSIQSIYMLNPLANIIINARDAIIYQKLPDITSVIITFIIASIILIVGYIYYNNRSQYFAEEL
jgi:lipopolysaccharide transport system permease protein